MSSNIGDGSHLQVYVDLDWRRLSRLQRNTKSVIIYIENKWHEIFEDPTTGFRTITETNEASPPLRIEFNLTSSQPRHIRYLLRNHLNNLRWLSGYLAPRISTAATDIGSGRNGFTIRVFVTLTFKKVVVTSPLSEVEESRQEMLMNLVLGGKIEGEDLNDINRETDSCSICLENFLCSNFTFPTRMSCSHVFHEACLLDWLEHENTCPMCRIVLYER